MILPCLVFLGRRGNSLMTLKPLELFLSEFSSNVRGFQKSRQTFPLTAGSSQNPVNILISFRRRYIQVNDTQDKDTSQ